MEPIPIDPDREAYVASIGEAAGIFADSAWRKERSVIRAAALIRKVGNFLDGETAKLDERGLPPAACAPGCNHCCHRRVYASVPEIVAIAAHVEANFDETSRSALSDRIGAEISNLESKIDNPVCPLLVDGLCSVYEARPMACRGMNSLSVEPCKRLREAGSEAFAVPDRQEQTLLAKSVEQALRSATAFHGMSSELVELRQGLRQAFETASLEHFLTQPAAAVDRAPIRSDRLIRTPGQPCGFLSSAPEVDRYLDILEKEGDTPKAILALKGAPPTVHDLLSITVPRMYSSEDEVDHWLEHWDRSLTNLENSDFDPVLAYDALGAHLTFELAYHGRDVKQRISRLGDLIHDRIVSKVLPDLAEPITAPRRPGRLRVGYISYALRNNNGGRWALGWLRNHAPDIETYAFNLHFTEDFISARFRESADYYFHLPGHVPDAARFIRSLDLDVLIITDLGMCGINTQYAALRLARVQCTAWGHPVTSGLQTVDYYLSSALMEPENGDDHYREKLVRLPNSGLCLTGFTPAPPKRSRDDYGLPKGFVPILAQNLMKCIPKWDELFKAINDRIGGPIVVLQAISPYEQRTIQERFEKAGILVHWIPRLPTDDFRDLLRHCSVSLDPPAWHGGNTTVETMTMGCPVVTLPTAFMRGRHSLAFLTQANAQGLIASSPDEYVEIACDQARLDAAMAGAQTEAVYEDREPVRSLDSLFHQIAGV